MISRARRLIVLAALLVLLLASPLVLLWMQTLLRQREAPVERPTLGQALTALDDQSFVQARLLAEQVDRSKLPAAEQGGPDYVLAVVAAQEADELWGQEKKDYFLLAARHLELARDRRYEPALTPESLLLLGKSLYLSGQVTESLPILEQALEAAPERGTEIHQLLSGAIATVPRPIWTARWSTTSNIWPAPI